MISQQCLGFKKLQFVGDIRTFERADLLLIIVNTILITKESLSNL
jgi:hypothetical protein